MTDDVFLIFTSKGVKRVLQATGRWSRVGGPALKAGEYRVRLRIQIPDSVFSPRTPVATIVVPEASVIQPEVAVEVMDPPEPPVETWRRQVDSEAHDG